MNEEAIKLEAQGYQLSFTLNHHELIPFVKKYLFKRNIFTLSYLATNLVFFFLLIAVMLVFTLKGTIGGAFSYFCFGGAATFLLVPIHELLHGAAYYICGAKNVSYKANWRKLYFMAVADKFVTSRQAFYFIALVPFAVISITMILLALISSPEMQIMWSTVAFVHASMCSGDFGLLSFFAENRNADLITFDDVENEKSYFYSR